MKIVIFTAVPFWHPGTQELIDRLKEKGIDVIALDIFHGMTVRNNAQPKSLIPFRQKGFFSKLYMRLFRTQFIKKHIEDGDVVDIHFIEPLYGKYLPVLKKKNVKLICTLFGSDLFRTNQKQKKDQLEMLAYSKNIILASNMVEYFEQYFPGLSDKYYFNQYGSARLDLINEMKGTGIKNNLKKKYNIESDQIVITCGYNGKKEQQHLEMLKEIKKMPNHYKQRILLVFPVTYGKEITYMEALKKEVDSMKIPYLWFEERLTDEELAETKLISDITINTQTTDALASSIKEAMVADNILLLGEWLPYHLYDDMKIVFKKITFESLSTELMSTLDNFELEKGKCLINANKILEFASWNVLIDGWVKLYNTVYHGSK